MSDPIANMLTMVRNAQAVGKQSLKVPYSNVKFALAQILQQEHFIARVEKSGRSKARYLDITLAYNEQKQGAITLIKQVSRPGQRMYYGYRDLQLRPGMTQILSTPKGLMTVRKAKKEKVGGELICELR